MLNYKLFENLQKAKKVLFDHKIPESNPDFIKLKDLLKNNMGYIGKFTEWMVVDHEPFDKIKDTFIELQNNPINKPFDSFKKLEELYDYIQSYTGDKKVNQMLKALPSGTRSFAEKSKELKDLLKMNIKYTKAIVDLYSKKGGRYKEIKKLISDTIDYITNISGDFNLENMLEKIKDYNVEIIEANPEILMIKVNDYKAAHDLGSIHWCISTSKSTFEQYANAFTVQYFIYDFTKKISDISHLIGATLNPNGEIAYAHYADDSKVEDLSIFDEL
jgi:hypothetical protein